MHETIIVIEQCDAAIQDLDIAIQETRNALQRTVALRNRTLGIKIQAELELEQYEKSYRTEDLLAGCE